MIILDLMTVCKEFAKDQLLFNLMSERDILKTC